MERRIEASPSSSQGDQVFGALAGELLRGRYAAESRLPPERELAARFGASRSTVREAVRRLESLGLLKARRGSGLVVQDLFRHGSISLLPAWLRVGAPGVAPAVLLHELLRLRRILLVEVVRMCSLYAVAGGLAESRALLDVAWRARADRPAFLRADFALTHALTRASGFAPAAWLLNAFEEGYVDLASTIAADMPVPRDYHRSWSAALDAIQERDTDRAVETVERYLERHDERLLEKVGLR